MKGQIDKQRRRRHRAFVIGAVRRTMPVLALDKARPEKLLGKRKGADDEQTTRLR